MEPAQAQDEEERKAPTKQKITTTTHDQQHHHHHPSSTRHQRAHSQTEGHGVVVQGELGVHAGELVNFHFHVQAKLESHRGHAREVKTIHHHSAWQKPRCREGKRKPSQLHDPRWIFPPRAREIPRNARVVRGEHGSRCVHRNGRGDWLGDAGQRTNASESGWCTGVRACSRSSLVCAVQQPLTSWERRSAGKRWCLVTFVCSLPQTTDICSSFSATRTAAK